MIHQKLRCIKKLVKRNRKKSGSIVSYQQRLILTPRCLQDVRLSMRLRKKLLAYFSLKVINKQVSNNSKISYLSNVFWRSNDTRTWNIICASFFLKHVPKPLIFDGTLRYDASLTAVLVSQKEPYLRFQARSRRGTRVVKASSLLVEKCSSHSLL